MAELCPRSSDSPSPEEIQVPTGSADSPAGSAQRQLLSESDIARTVDRIAHQILERDHAAAATGDIVLLGIPTRGSHLADRLAARLSVFTGRSVVAGALDTTLYRDDLRSQGPRALAATIMPPGGIDGRTVILVDDVLFSGRTIRAAFDALRDHGRPAMVQLAVLVDRGHRQLPIRADYVGKNIPTALTDSVAVKFVESDGYDAVELRRAP